MSPDVEPKMITFVIDGREVVAPEGEMLVDAAKRGDVEIPVFCYEPKLGPPVGACRMCLVEIEGIPKLQTGCSTPVRDGMVVYTQTDRAREAQESVVEFLLVNHPLDCPVCDKGGECPLQDITMGWGPDRSRFTDPKRHFQKPLELSPLIAIDRERCILCYRCVRFSQEVSEDEQLQLLERGDRSFVGTFHDRPYVAPFHGNIIELCPVGALTSRPYRFRARPWEVEDAGSICTLCPSQCNIKFTLRDERVMRVLARDNAEVDDGWLCDKGRFGYQMIESPERITTPLIRRGGELQPATWEEALTAVATGLREHGSSSAAIAGGDTSNEEGYLLQRLMREALGSPHVDSRSAGPIDRDLLLELSRPDLSAATSDLDRATAVLVIDTDPLHASPILDLRIRKVVRRNGTSLAIASSRPTALDGGAVEVARYAPGGAGEFLAQIASTLQGTTPTESSPATDIANLLRDSESVVIVWGERLSHGPHGDDALRALLTIAATLGLANKPGAGLLEVPDSTNARGLREVGCLPTAGPGLSKVVEGKSAPQIATALESGDLGALLILNANPPRDYPDSTTWDRALAKAPFVATTAMFHNETTHHANVVLPAESHAEKDGTITHPDGRLQRLRPGIRHPGDTRMGWQVLTELSNHLGHELNIHTAPMVLAEITNRVPFYAGITLEEIGGPGIRWQAREPATQLPPPESPVGVGVPGEVSAPRHQLDESPPLPTAASPPGGPLAAPAPPTRPGLRLGTYRDIWAGEITDRNPALTFLAPHQRLELAPEDAQHLGVANGEEVTVSQNGTSINARVALDNRIAAGTAFLIEGTATDNATALIDETGAPSVEVRKPT